MTIFEADQKNFLEPAMFCCTHLAWQGKRPKVHAKRKGFKNFFWPANHNFLKIIQKVYFHFFLIKAKDDNENNEDKGMCRKISI